MLQKRKKFFRFLGDSRGSEMLETIAKIAFIALPVMAVLLYSMKHFNKKYTESAGKVKEAQTEAQSGVGEMKTAFDDEKKDDTAAPAPAP